MVDLDIVFKYHQVQAFLCTVFIYFTPLANLRFMKHLQAEITLKQLENVSPPLMKQVLPLVEQLPPLYMDLVKGREDFTPKPEETRRLVCDISDQ